MSKKFLKMLSVYGLAKNNKQNIIYAVRHINIKLGESKKNKTSLRKNLPFYF